MTEVKIDNKTKRTDLTEGPILSKMILFALPIIATSILQQAFNTADMAILGRFVGETAYAAVGSTSTIVGLFIEFFLGFSIGANVVISRFVGNKNAEQTSKAVHTSLCFALLCGILIAIMGIALIQPLLVLTKVPTELAKDATIYLSIYFAGMPIYMLYNFASATFRSVGKTKLPLYCLTIGGVLNVALNVLFVTVFSMKVEGVAIATVLSNVLSLILMLIALKREREDIRFSIKKCKIDKSILGSVIKIGLPSGLLGSVFSISNLCVQSAVNSLGTKVISASSSASNVEIYVQYVGNAFAQTCATFISQNLGAKKQDRCKKIVVTALGVCIAITFVLSIGVYLLSSTILKIFTTDEVVISFARQRMRYTLLFKCVQSVMDIMVGVLQGYGKTFIPASISLIGVCGFRLVWIFTLFNLNPSVDSLFIIYPITWAIASICDVVYFIVCYNKTKREQLTQLQNEQNQISQSQAEMGESV